MRYRTFLLSLVLLFCAAGTALAQQAPPPPGGPLVFEPVHDGFLVAPEVKVTRVDGKVSTMAGGVGGWLKDDHLFVGGGGYFLPGRERGSRRLGYGGVIVGWFFNPEQKVSVAARGLVGFGQFTEWSTVEVPYCLLPEQYLCSGSSRYADHYTRSVWFENNFAVAEPEISVLAKLGRRVRLSGAAGYRLASDRRGLPHADGPTGTVSVQFVF